MSRQPVPGEVWTRTLTGREYECLATFAGEFHRWAAWGAHVDCTHGQPRWGSTSVILSPEVFHVSDMTPPPELPPAELVASVGEHWTNVYPGGHGGWFAAQNSADAFAGRSRVWLIHPDGRWQKCNGKEVIGEPVEVPR